MSAIVETYHETASAARLQEVHRISEAARDTASRLPPSHREQLESLVQQLFFQGKSPVRHVGFTAAENATEIQNLCLDVAEVLSEQGTCDVGLIDAAPGGPPVEHLLELPHIATSESAWPLKSHLWFVSRENWLPEGADRVVTEHDLGRLHDLTAKFDFSILCCPSLSWVAARIGRACEGLVLVLTANKTRRVVASKMREQLRSAQVPLLGTVLAERRFPIPAGVYRSL